MGSGNAAGISTVNLDVCTVYLELACCESLHAGQLGLYSISFIVFVLCIP